MAYTDEQRVEALAIAAVEGLHEAARRTGVPRSTIRLWRDSIPGAKPVAQPVPLAERYDLVERVQAEIERIAFGNLSDVVQWDADGAVTLTPSAELTPGQAALISEIRVTRTGMVSESVTIKTRDKLAALKTLAQMPHVGLLPTAGAQVTIDARQQSVNVYDQLSAEELRQLIALQLPPGEGDGGDG